jgi:hypothetical protein
VQVDATTFVESVMLIVWELLPLEAKSIKFELVATGTCQWTVKWTALDYCWLISSPGSSLSDDCCLTHTSMNRGTSFGGRRDGRDEEDEFAPSGCENPLNLEQMVKLTGYETSTLCQPGSRAKKSRGGTPKIKVE